jgi:hypothetical protein
VRIDFSYDIGGDRVKYSVRVVYLHDKHGSFIVPCPDLEYAEYFAFEYAKMHPEAEFLEIYEGDNCVGLLRPADALEADPAVHIGEYDTQRDPRIKEKLNHAIMIRKDMLEAIERAEKKHQERGKESF